MNWISVEDRLPLFTNLVLILTDYDDTYLGYLHQDGKWYCNCPCCEKCQIHDVVYWKDFED